MRYIRVSKIKTALGGVAAISGLRVFGKGKNDLPKAVEKVEFSRSTVGLDVELKWENISNADGYNVRFGIAPDKMYNSWQLFNKNELVLSLLNKGTAYYIAIDSFNENGVSAGKAIYVS